MGRLPSTPEYSKGTLGQYLYRRNKQEVWLDAKVVDVYRLAILVEFVHPPSKYLRGGYRERRWLRTQAERERFTTS